MSDKPLVQQGLAQELADLVISVSGASGDMKRTSPDAPGLSALDFYAGFWQTIAREWMGVDKFRINKYYMLMRRYVNAGLRLLRAFSWNSDMVSRFNATLSRPGGPLAYVAADSPNDVHVPASLAYHVSDVLLDELDRVASGDDGKVPLVPLLMPFVELAAKSTSRAVHERVMSSVIEPVLDECGRIEQAATSHKRQRVEVEARFPSLIASMEDVDGDAETTAGRVRYHLLYTLFKVAGGEDTYTPSRRRLYALWQAEQEDE